MVDPLACRYCGLAPQELVFARERGGKPELCAAAHPPARLPGGRRLRFNLSHTPSLLGALRRPRVPGHRIRSGLGNSL